MFLLLLFIVQGFWAASLGARQIALVDMPIGLILILRYGLSSLILLLFGTFKGASQFSRRDWLLILFIGIGNFSLSPYLQLKGIELTQTIDLSILIATEPFIIALMATISLKEKLTWEMVVVFILSAIGVLILSGWNWETFSLPMTHERFLGNILFLLALLFESINTTASRYLTQRHDPLKLFAWIMGIGAITNLIIYYKTVLEIPPLHYPFMGSWLSIGFLVLGPTLISYGIWFWLTKRIEASRLALSLFLQPLIGVFLGYFFLDENVDHQTIIGASLIFITLLTWGLKKFLGEK